MRRESQSGAWPHGFEERSEWFAVEPLADCDLGDPLALEFGESAGRLARVA